MQDQRVQSNTRIEVWVQESLEGDDWPPSPSAIMMVDVDDAPTQAES